EEHRSCAPPRGLLATATRATTARCSGLRRLARREYPLDVRAEVARALRILLVLDHDLDLRADQIVRVEVEVLGILTDFDLIASALGDEVRGDASALALQREVREHLPTRVLSVVDGELGRDVAGLRTLLDLAEARDFRRIGSIRNRCEALCFLHGQVDSRHDLTS